MNKHKYVMVIVLMFTVMAITIGCGSSDSKSKANKDGKWKTISASPNVDNTMTSGDSDIKSGGFTANLPTSFVQPTDDVGKKLLKEYGAVFVAKGGAVPPNVVVFKDAGEVSTFQSGVSATSETVGGITVELQSPAMKALKDAVAEANQGGMSITPRGNDAARRSYEDTVTLWASRVNPGLTHWAGAGRITDADAKRIRSLSPYDQVPEIFKLESQGIFFAKDLSKSIIYSVAPPGSSQHLSMLALDVSEHENSQVRVILSKHGWFQTVVSDLPHFTFLGVAENALPTMGLRKVNSGGRTYWVPAL